MVDVVCVADSARQVNQIADGSNDVFENDVLRAELLATSLEFALKLFFVLSGSLDDIHKNRIENLLRKLVRSQVDIQILLRIYEVVTDNLGWGTMYVHYWGGSSESTWPGVQMSDEGDNGFGSHNFSASVPSDATGYVFTKGADGSIKIQGIESNSSKIIENNSDKK